MMNLIFSVCFILARSKILNKNSAILSGYIKSDIDFDSALSFKPFVLIVNKTNPSFDNIHGSVAVFLDYPLCSIPRLSNQALMAGAIASLSISSQFSETLKKETLLESGRSFNRILCKERECFNGETIICNEEWNFCLHKKICVLAEFLQKDPESHLIYSENAMEVEMIELKPLIDIDKNIEDEVNDDEDMREFEIAEDENFEFKIYDSEDSRKEEKTIILPISTIRTNSNRNYHGDSASNYCYSRYISKLELYYQEAYLIQISNRTSDICFEHISNFLTGHTVLTEAPLKLKKTTSIISYLYFGIVIVLCCSFQCIIGIILLSLVMIKKAITKRLNGAVVNSNHEVFELVPLVFDKSLKFFGDPFCSIDVHEFEEEKDLVSITPCLHAFHYECLKKWLKIHNKMKCPNCNASINHMKTSSWAYLLE